MSVHVYLAGLGVYLHRGSKQRLQMEMPCQWLTSACEAFGDEAVQIPVAPHFPEIIQNVQRELAARIFWPLLKKFDGNYDKISHKGLIG